MPVGRLSPSPTPSPPGSHWCDLRTVHSYGGWIPPDRCSRPGVWVTTRRDSTASPTSPSPPRSERWDWSNCRLPSTSGTVGGDSGRCNDWWRRLAGPASSSSWTPNGEMSGPPMSVRGGLPRTRSPARGRRPHRPSLSRSVRHGSVRRPGPRIGELPPGRDTILQSGGPGGAVGGAGPGHRVEDELIAAIGRWNNRLAPGQIGPVGAVVGPTHFDAPLDLLGANGLFLAPGVGAQGATPADVARVFATCPDRVMPSASRSLLEGGPDVGRLRDGTLALASGLHQALGV